MLMLPTIHKAIDKWAKMLYKYIGEISGAFARYVKNVYNGRTCEISR